MFVADIDHFIAARGVDLVRFARGQRKDDVTRGYLHRAELDGRGLVPEQVLYVGVAQEKQKVFRTVKRRNPVTGATYPWLVPGSGVVNQYYFYCADEDFGPVCVKFSGYFPYTGRLIINGNEYAKRQAAKAGIGFTPLDNGFASVDAVAAVQAICDSLDAGKIEALAARLLAMLPYPFTADDAAAGYRYEPSVPQAEFSLTQVLDSPVAGRIFFEQVIRDNLEIGRPDQAGLVFGRRVRGGRKRPTPGRFRTRVITDGVVPSLHIDYKNSKIKQYHKLGAALRTETTINDTHLGCQRRIHNLPEQQARARAVNARLLHTEKVGQGCVFDSPAFARISQPSLTGDGRRAPGLRFGDPRAQALAGALANMLCAVTGITNKSLRALMTGLLGTAYGINQASYDLGRLSRNGLIARVPHRNLYTLTPDGLRFAIFYTKVHDRLLRPLMASDQPQAPPALRQALRTIDREVSMRIAAARLPAAA